MRELIVIVKMNREDELRGVLGVDRFERLVCELRDVVQAACRDTDSTWRGEDDACLAILTVEDRQSGVTLAERIRSHVAEHVFDVGDGVEVGITCAIGFASYPVPEVDPDLVVWRQAVLLARRALDEAESVADDDWVGFVSPARPVGASGGRAACLDNPRLVVRHDLEAARRSRCDLDMLLLATGAGRDPDVDAAR
jgi:GGDEF domain-containing protein